MSRLCNLRVYSAIKCSNHATNLPNKLMLNTADALKNVLYRNGKGYTELCWKFQKHIYPLHRFLDILKSKEIRPLLTRLRMLLNKYDINRERRHYRNLGFILGGIGITIALCEAKNFQRGTSHFMLTIADERMKIFQRNLLICYINIFHQRNSSSVLRNMVTFQN